MKKIILLSLAFFLISSITVHAQFLTQSADGKSSIPLPLNGIGVGVDIGKTEVAIGLNNYERVLRSADKKFRNNFLLGFNLSAKSSDGLANLFSGGDIVPEGNFLGFLGYSISNNKAIVHAYLKSPLERSLQNETAQQQELFSDYKIALVKAIKSSIGLIKNISLRQKAKKDLTALIKKEQHFKNLNDDMNDYGKDNEELKEFAKKLSDEMEISKIIYATKFKKIRQSTTPTTIENYNDFIKKTWPVRITPFLIGGINARNFTRYLKLDQDNLAKSFQDTLYRGGTFGLGLNVQVKNYWLGVTYSYLDGDNFINLKSKEYTIKTTDTSSNQSLTSEKKITGYSGKYSKVETNQLNIDIVADYRLSDSSRILVNPYLRSSLFSRDTAFLKNYTNVGLGLYFIGKKSKFLGGLYIELPDLNNKIEKAKPASEIDIRPPLKKLTFGIVTKFSISSLLAWANRPAKPD